MKTTRLFVYFAILATAPGSPWARKEKVVQGNQQPEQILIVGLDKNVKSNYYHDGLIAVQTGIQVGSIDQRYNTIIAANIVAAGNNGFCRFTFGKQEAEVHCERIVGKMQTGFVAFSKDVRKGVTLPVIGLEDITPLIARLLHIDFPSADGILYPGLPGKQARRYTVKTTARLDNTRKKVFPSGGTPLCLCRGVLAKRI